MLKYIIAIVQLSIATLSYASDITVKPVGSFDFQASYLKSNAPSQSPHSVTARPNFVSANQKNLAFASTASFGIEAKNTHESGLVYGAKIGIMTAVKNMRKTQSVVFVESSAGRLEFGSDKSAMTKMRISPYSVAAATGGMWDVWVRGDPVATASSQIAYITSFANFLDSKMRASGKVEYSRKITYYTPKMHGLQLGVSFIPDSSNVGYAAVEDKIDHTPVVSNYYYSVKNGVAAGLTYAHKLRELDVTFSAVGEMGKVVAKAKDPALVTATNTASQTRNLKNYTLGIEFDYHNFSIAGSFGDYMRSFASSSDKEASSELYGVGAGYQFDKLSTSITYMGSSYRRNKIHATTIGADYKIAQGFLPYAEVTYFATRRNSSDNNIHHRNHKGWLVLAGAKIEF